MPKRSIRKLKDKYLYSHYYSEDKKLCLELGIPYAHAFVSLKSLAKEYGFSYGYIRNLSSRENWKSKKLIKIVKTAISEKKQEILKEKGYKLSK